MIMRIPEPTGRPADGHLKKSWIALGFGFPASLVLLSGLLQEQRFDAVASMTLSISGVVLAGWMWILLWRQKTARTQFSITYRPVASHWVQALVQASIYVYWGWYWPPVYEHAPLIVAQIAFAYSFEMLLSLSRRRSWTMGFGPFPIILSTNLFLLFRPEWFYLQFGVVAVGILGKEFIRWNRDGRNTHIFNPSAFSLFVFSVFLIATNSTSLSYAEEIATRLTEPPFIYLFIFLVGLIVQSLFSVTLVTLMAAAALIALNLAYTSATGTYYFVDSSIPIAVFLGLHLLITDPATSPRTALGKAAYGALYGAGVFALYGLLDWLGAPRFYDKLLCVPILNLLVPLIDAAARRLGTASIADTRGYSEISAAANRWHMAIWIAVFATMLSTSFVGSRHPGTSVAFWNEACDEGLRNGCKTLFDIDRSNCASGDAAACADAGRVGREHPEVTDRILQGHLLSRGCELGSTEACDVFREYAEQGGKGLLDRACDENDYRSCFVAGLLNEFGIGTPVDSQSAIEHWEKACDGGWGQACGYLGDAYLLGHFAPEEPETAAHYFTQACTLRYLPGCTTLGQMYQRGHGVPQDPERGLRLIGDACDAGLEPACAALSPENARTRVPPR